MPHLDDAPSPVDPVAWLLRFHRGTLAFGDRRADARFVVERPSGATAPPTVIVAAEPEAMRRESWLIMSPEESSCQMQLLLKPSAISEPAFDLHVDRWKAYHLTADKSTFARCEIEGMRVHRESDGDSFSVFDADELAHAPLARGIEPRLVKHANTDPARLARACRARAGIDVPDPCCVGVDARGIDIRARFGIVRLEFSRALGLDEAALLAAVEETLT
jgi:hypothetical protein